MKRVLITVSVLITLLLLAGCGKWQQIQAHYEGYTTVCVRGLSVIQMPTGSFYERNAQDHLIPCNP